jgi:hypothetical protein
MSTKEVAKHFVTRWEQNAKAEILAGAVSLALIYVGRKVAS